MGNGREKEEYEEPLRTLRQKLRASAKADEEERAVAARETNISTAGAYHASVPSAPRGQQQPLIAQVTNSWRDDEKALQQDIAEDDTHELPFCDLEDGESCPNLSKDLVRSRRLRRMWAMIILACILVYYGYRWFIQPQLQDEWEFTEGFMLSRSNGTYGLARGSNFEGTRIKDLDESLLPGGPSDPHGKRRLVFVGDIHGCKDELTHLLEKVGFDKKTDHLIATGDTVSKGPDNIGVLDELISIGAESVRGNHEDRLLEGAKTLAGTNLRPESEAATSQGYHKDAKLLRKMKKRHMKYLRHMPLMLRIPALPLASSKGRKGDHHITTEITVVHGGLVPHLPLKKQDPYFVMNMRSVDMRTHVPSALHTTKSGKSRPWTELWNWYNTRIASGRSVKGFHVYSEEEWNASQQQAPSFLERLKHVLFGGNAQALLSRPKPRTVVYGHDSKLGLQLHRWSKGLDSACVAGGKLTAMVLNAQGRTEVVSVGCKNHRG